MQQRARPSGLKIYCDGGARGNPGPAAGAFVVIIEKKIVYSDSRYLGKTTNNVAEHSAVYDALVWLSKNKNFLKSSASFFLDSQLVVRQLSGTYKIKSPNLKPLVLKTKALEKTIGSKVDYNYIPRAKNKLADELVNKQLDKSLSES